MFIVRFFTAKEAFTQPINHKYVFKHEIFLKHFFSSFPLNLSTFWETWKNFFPFWLFLFFVKRFFIYRKDFTKRLLLASKTLEKFCLFIVSYSYAICASMKKSFSEVFTFSFRSNRPSTSLPSIFKRSWKIFLAL